MVEFALIVALVIVARRLRRAPREMPRAMRIDVYHHFSGGPGERRPADNVLILNRPVGANVVPLRRRYR
jgi:hypothetical protein